MDAQSAAFSQERKLGAHDRKELAPERSMTKARALTTRMSPQSMEMHAKRAGVSLSDAGSRANSPAQGAFYRPDDRHVHVPDGLLPEFVHEGGVKGGGHHYIDTSKQARVAASTPREATFDDELAASTTGIKAARRVGLKVTQADARYLTKALGTYAGGGRDNKVRDRFVELARKGVFRKLASTESIGARAGNLQEALSLDPVKKLYYSIKNRGPNPDDFRDLRAVVQGHKPAAWVQHTARTSQFMRAHPEFSNAYTGNGRTAFGAERNVAEIKDATSNVPKGGSARFHRRMGQALGYPPAEVRRFTRDFIARRRRAKPNYADRFKGKAASMMTNKTFGNIPESAVTRAGNLQEALSEKVRADIPKNKFAAPTMSRVGHVDKGLYPIFDKKSAESALKLSGRHPHLKREIARRAAAYGVKPEKKGTRYA
jgi:hypothetical protein